jgi:hypothetical protein
VCKFSHCGVSCCCHHRSTPYLSQCVAVIIIVRHSRRSTCRSHCSTPLLYVAVVTIVVVVRRIRHNKSQSPLQHVTAVVTTRHRIHSHRTRRSTSHGSTFGGHNVMWVKRINWLLDTEQKLNNFISCPVAQWNTVTFAALNRIWTIEVSISWCYITYFLYFSYAFINCFMWYLYVYQLWIFVYVILTTYYCRILESTLLV